MNQAIERHLEAAGLGGIITVGMGPVLFLLEVRGSALPSEIADELGIPRSTMTSLRSQLHGRELIVVEPDPDDGRARRLRLTKRGRSVVRALRRIEKRIDRAILSALDEGEEEWFEARLARVTTALRKA